MNTHPDALVGAVGEKIAAHLDEIRSYFKPNTAITVVIRPASAVDHSRDMIMTSDSIPKVIEALHYQQSTTDMTHATVRADE